MSRDPRKDRAAKKRRRRRQERWEARRIDNFIAEHAMLFIAWSAASRLLPGVEQWMGRRPW